jgi:hypothetical protein
LWAVSKASANDRVPQASNGSGTTTAYETVALPLSCVGARIQNGLIS